VIPECLTLFLHHDAGDVTQRHHRLVTVLNPRLPVVPLSFGAGLGPRVVPSLSRSYHAEPRDQGSQWWHCDRLVWAWFRSTRLWARRYVILESDTLCHESISGFYSGVWHEPAAAAAIATTETQPCYNYFKYESGQNLAALYPISGIMLSHATMATVAGEVKKPEYEDMFCEVRVGTALRRLGIEPKIIRPDAEDYLSWIERKPVGLQGIWHPVRELVTI
jgi:hypothetical protein